MKQISLFAFFALLLGGCAQEAIYVDHEFGMAQNDAFDRQIVHKDYAHAGKPTDGLAGIHVEKTMETYHETFTDAFTKESIDITQKGAE